MKAGLSANDLLRLAPTLACRLPVALVLTKAMQALPSSPAGNGRLKDPGRLKSAGAQFGEKSQELELAVFLL
jgi:hypothetical protein